MKKIKKFAYAGAIALLSVVGFTACSSSDGVAEVVEPSPNYNPTTGEVLTKLVFNVSTGNTMRQTSAATQASSSESFRGINSAVLLSFKNANGDDKHIVASGTADKRYDLQSIMAAGSISSTASNRVIETSLPLNTNSLLFYGKATEPTTTNYEAFGHLEDFSIAADATGLDMSKTNIELAARINGNLEDFQKIEDLLGGILTCIMNSNLAGTHHSAVSFEGNSVTYPDGIYWSSYANADGTSPVTPSHDLYPLEIKLANGYKEMTNIRDNEGELRGGCAHNLIYTIQALWSVINEIRFATPFCKEEAVAQALANHIHNRIGNYFNGTVPTTGAEVTGVSIKTATDNIISAFVADTAWPTEAGEKPSDFTSINSVNLNQFPEDLYHLPAGAAHYLFDSTKKLFYYQQDYNTSAVGSGGGFNVSSYYYPAELCYFGNSPIRTSSTQVRPNQYPNGVANWKNDDSWNNEVWSGTHVISSTQAVAMKNNINYGTSLLQTTVGYGSATLEDNNHKIQHYKDPTISDTDEPNKVITVSGTSFLLKGVLIGGQSKKVGWDYLPKAVTDPETNPLGYVYDNVLASTSIPATGTSAANYTLVFDNYKANPSDGKQDKVYIALELINNTGQDFFGEYGLIRDQGTFYLIGELDPNGKEPTWAESDHPLPPYNSDGTTNKVSRVFIQDYMTKAKFVIGPTSLQHAYLTVPDLRYSALTLGLSVDLKWETGIDFGDVTLGGNSNN